MHLDKSAAASVISKNVQFFLNGFLQSNVKVCPLVQEQAAHWLKRMFNAASNTPLPTPPTVAAATRPTFTTRWVKKRLQTLTTLPCLPKAPFPSSLPANLAPLPLSDVIALLEDSLNVSHELPATEEAVPVSPPSLVAADVDPVVGPLDEIVVAAAAVDEIAAAVDVAGDASVAISTTSGVAAAPTPAIPASVAVAAIVAAVVAALDISSRVNSPSGHPKLHRYSTSFPANHKNKKVWYIVGARRFRKVNPPPRPLSLFQIQPGYFCCEDRLLSASFGFATCA
ncbi:hypothetical protein OsI_36854 [Oryza sativa Indica Group]|uniref:Uncharacterized protein n=1 Tax=Oryza sativa subsp. indica TaxID=39946 RepID=B8BLL2_ORYSI|nr:hypothetical protein OsI_36854 [Oryza sativa Indica Group]